GGEGGGGGRGEGGAEEVRAGGAEGGADGELAATRRGTSEREVGHVRRGDQHQEADRREEHQQGRPYASHERVAKRGDVRAGEVRVLSVLATDTGGDPVELGAGGRERHARPEPPDAAPVVRRAAVLERPPLARDPELYLLGKPESRRHHADDAVEVRVEPERETRESVLAREVPVPERSGDDSGGRSSHAELVPREGAADRRPRPERGEEVGRDDRDRGAHRLRSAGNGDVVPGVLRERVEAAAALPHVAE